MGATSVTGKGQGAAANLKGPGNNRNFWVPMIGPHIVAAGKVTSYDGSDVVYVPVLPEGSVFEGLATDTDLYCVFVSAAHACTVAYTAVANTANLALVIGGTTADVIDWQIVKINHNDPPATPPSDPNLL